MKRESALSGILSAAKGNTQDQSDKESAPEQYRRKQPEQKPVKQRISKAVNTEIPKAVNTEIPKRGTEKLVHITIEVPESLRHHWKIESARRNRSFREVAVAAFTEEFGLPKKGEN